MATPDWVNHPLYQRAPRGGDVEFGKEYRGGQYEPFYVPRPVMPQVDEQHYADLIEFCRGHGYDCRLLAVDPDSVRPHQRITVTHAMGLSPEILSKPCIISNEPYILDGHHRWYEHKHLKLALSAYQIDLDFTAAVKLLFEFPYTYSYGDGNEHPFSY